MEISPVLLYGIYWVALAVAVIASVVFIYHWKQYGVNGRMTKIIIIGYSAITAGFFIIAFILLRAAVA